MWRIQRELKIKIFQGVDQMTGNELRARRKEMRLTQKELGEPLGVSYQAIQKWEARGDAQAEIHAKHWQALASKLAISIDLLYPAKNEQLTASINASNGSTVLSAGRDANQITQGSDFVLRPLERQAIELNREVGNDNLLKGFINRLLDVKERTKDMY